MADSIRVQALVDTRLSEDRRRFELTFADAKGVATTISMPARTAGELAPVLATLAERLRCEDGPALTKMAKLPQVGRARHERLVLRFLMSRCRDAELTADLAAETFIKALEAAERFDSARSGGTSAVPWLLTIARKTLVDSVRRGVVADDARRRLGCEPLALSDDALTRVELRASLEVPLEQLLGDLPDDLRDAEGRARPHDRDEPHLSPSWTVVGVPPAARHPGTFDLRTERRRAAAARGSAGLKQLSAVSSRLQPPSALKLMAAEC